MVRSLVAVLLVAAAVSAQDAKRPVVPADYFTLRGVTELAVSPDGQHVAYALATWAEFDDARKADLWVLDLATKQSTRLTFDRANDRHLRWAADGKHLYALGNRKRAAEPNAPHDGKSQVWRIPASGGTPTAMTRVNGGVTGYDLAAKADAVVYAVDDTHRDDDGLAALRKKFAGVEYGHGVRTVSTLHRLNLKTFADEKLPTDARYIRELAVTADGKRVAMVTAFDDTVVKSEGESRVDVWEGGKTVTPPTDAYRAKAATPYAWLEGLAWSADGSKFAFVEVHDGYPAEVIVGDSSGGGWQVSKLKRDGWEVVGYGRAVGPPVQFDADGQLVIQTEANAVTGFGRWDFAAGKLTPAEAKDNVSSVSADGKVQLVSTPTAFAEIFADGKPATDLNPQVQSWALPTVKHVTWKASDGSTVGGVLELPPGTKPGTKLPLVVGIHGGPTTSTKADLAFDPHNGRLYFSAAGYAVLLPNYRGSTGYGDKFLTDLVGRENDIEVKDILAGIQHLVKEGIADPDRVACMGWSNGGYLTNCLITLKDPPVKLRAASSGAGIVDTVSEWGFNDEPAYPVVFKKGTPWETPEIYRKTSPTYGLGNVTTPTIVHVGGADVRCPPGHSRMLYRALKEYRRVPTELIVYTGEPHGLTKQTNRQAKMEFDLAWFAKYLGK
jgi:dipeptidyl aminopeptidase/acylaminoacyl peptidase